MVVFLSLILFVLSSQERASHFASLPTSSPNRIEALQDAERAAFESRFAIRGLENEIKFDTNYRSTVDILSSCLLTIFACTWISVHPNVVGYQSTWRSALKARMELMLWAIFAPELIVVFAFRQWNGARVIKRKINILAKQEKSMAWSDAHAHLLQMGGFVVREKDGCVHYFDFDAYLSPQADEERSSEMAQKISQGYPPAWSSLEQTSIGKQQSEHFHPHHIRPSPERLGASLYPVDSRISTGSITTIPLPPPPSVQSVLSLVSSNHRYLLALLHSNISEEDIWDRSKGDFLAKGFVILQTTWFVVQCVARGAQNLELTHLEITTIAYASLNLVMYYFWWNKPLDVQRPIVLDLASLDESGSENPLRDAESTLVAPLFRPPPRCHLQEDNDRIYDIAGRYASSDLGNAQEESQGRRGYNKRGTDFGSLWQTLTNVSVSCCAQIRLFIIEVRLRKATFFPRLRSIVQYYPIFDSPGISTKPKSAEFPTFYAVPLPAVTFGGRQSASPQLAANHSLTQLMGLVLASAFGAIHCIAWNFPNPSPLSRLLWNISSLCIIASPVFLILFYVLVFLMQWPRHAPLIELSRPMGITVLWLRRVGHLAILVYVPARFILIVLAFTDLRRLSDSAHRTVEWSSFVPHV